MQDLTNLESIPQVDQPGTVLIFRRVSIINLASVDTQTQLWPKLSMLLAGRLVVHFCSYMYRWGT